MTASLSCVLSHIHTLVGPDHTLLLPEAPISCASDYNRIYFRLQQISRGALRRCKLKVARGAEGEGWHLAIKSPEGAWEGTLPAKAPIPPWFWEELAVAAGVERRLRLCRFVGQSGQVVAWLLPEEILALTDKGFPPELVAPLSPASQPFSAPLAA